MITNVDLFILNVKKDHLTSTSLSRYSKTLFENIPIEINENKTSIDPSFMIEESFNLICDTQNLKTGSIDRIRISVK